MVPCAVPNKSIIPGRKKGGNMFYVKERYAHAWCEGTDGKERYKLALWDVLKTFSSSNLIYQQA